MSEIKVIDDFLNEEHFERLMIIFDQFIPWTFSDILADNKITCDKNPTKKSLGTFITL